MGRKKGSKNRTKVTVDGEVKLNRSRGIADKILPTSSDPAVSFTMDDREAINERAEAASRGETLHDTEVTAEQVTDAMEGENIPEVAETATEATEEVVETDTTTETVESVTPTVEAEKAEYVAEPKVEVKPEEEAIKTVPLAALHEERQKRREDRVRIERLEEQLKTKPTPQAETTDDEYVTDEEKRLQAMEQRLQGYESREADRERTIEKSETDTAVNALDTHLAEKGFPGFKTIGREQVKIKLSEMYSINPEHAEAHDTPDGWAKLYTEMYPEIKAIFDSQARTENFDKKNELKAKANLVNNVGKKEAPIVDTKKALSAKDEYLAERSLTRL